MNTVQRSTFVTAIAWIFIVLSGFGTLSSILQNIMIHTLFKGSEMQQAMQVQPEPDMPGFAMFMVNNVELFFAMFLVVSVVMLASSIGLLKRNNAARVVFIGLMILGIALILSSTVFQLTMLSVMQDSFAGAAGAPDMKLFFVAMAAFSSLIALGFIVLLGWIVKRLLSPAVVSEFKT